MFKGSRDRRQWMFSLSSSDPNEKVCVWICLTLQRQMTRSAQTISFRVIYVWLCRDSTDFFSALNLPGRAIYAWLCRNFDFHTEQLSAENRPTFRRIQTGLLCRARSNIFTKSLCFDIWNQSFGLSLTESTSIMGPVGNPSSTLYAPKLSNPWVHLPQRDQHLLLIWCWRINLKYSW